MAISEKGKRILAGFCEENTRKIVNADACDIQDQQANAIVHDCKQLFIKHHIDPYRDDKGTGLIRHVLVKTAAATGEILVVLVTAAEVFPGRNNFVTDLRAAHPEITSIVQNVNSRITPVVLGDLERVVYGKGYIEDVLMGKRFRIGAKTFFQVNPKQTEVALPKGDRIRQAEGDRRRHRRLFRRRNDRDHPLRLWSRRCTASNSIRHP
ncbi:MAG: hypothetical protein M0C28_18530 [Candidatus Moduliflexus flocculans]|nr:hypothetical protein [Candidatus Moduliflexus flocculans]